MSSKTIFLASKSPRRRDLLTRLGYDVRVIASNAHTLMAFEGDEVVLPDEAPKAYVLRTAVYVGLSETACDWRISHSTVSFRELTHDEIEAYANSGEPYDKAGGYGIQGLASIFISNISGSYTGIMGLPVYETAELLANAGLPVFNAQ